MKIFWSWQSDTPGKIGRFFVRDVLNDAITQLKSDAEVIEPTEREAREALHLDQDREGVPGSPDLARTILEKIESAAVFVADVTTIGVSAMPRADTEENDNPPKKLINANVAIELGYALHALTDRALLMVMNAHYGTRDDLPFDLRHKGGPLIFDLAPDADKATRDAAAVTLKAQLTKALKLCISAKIEEERKNQKLVQPEPARTSFFAPIEALAKGGFPVEKEYRFQHQCYTYLRLFAAGQHAPVGRARIAKLFDAGKIWPLSTNPGGIRGRNSYGSISFTLDAADDSMATFTQGFPTGELWGMNAELFRLHTRNSSIGNKTSEFVVVPMIALERVYVFALGCYVAAAAEFGLPPPYTVVLGAVGLANSYLGVPTGGPFGRGELVGPVMQNELQQTATLSATDKASMQRVLRDFFSAIYDLADCIRPDILTDQIVADYGLPPR